VCKSGHPNTQGPWHCSPCTQGPWYGMVYTGSITPRQCSLHSNGPIPLPGPGPHTALHWIPGLPPPTHCTPLEPRPPPGPHTALHCSPGWRHASSLSVAVCRSGWRQTGWRMEGGRVVLSTAQCYPLPGAIHYVPGAIHCLVLSTARCYPLPGAIHCLMLSTARCYPLPSAIQTRPFPTPVRLSQQ
jgi:hypothetical protein